MDIPNQNLKLHITELFTIAAAAPAAGTKYCLSFSFVMGIVVERVFILSKADPQTLVVFESAQKVAAFLCINEYNKYAIDGIKTNVIITCVITCLYKYKLLLSLVINFILLCRLVQVVFVEICLFNQPNQIVIILYYRK